MLTLSRTHESSGPSSYPAIIKRQLSSQHTIRRLRLPLPALPPWLERPWTPIARLARNDIASERLRHPILVAVVEVIVPNVLYRRRIDAEGEPRRGALLQRHHTEWEVRVDSNLGQRDGS